VTAETVQARPPSPTKKAKNARNALVEADADFEVVGVTKKTDQTIPVKEDDNPFQVSVKLHSKFARFPAALRSIIEKTYTTTLVAESEILKTAIRPGAQQTYNIIAGRCIRPSAAGFATSTRTHGIMDLSVANAQLLQQFIDKNEEAMRTAAFVQLKTQEGMANPDFIHLHCVRHGELSWGLDCNGCLSLYSARIADQKLEEHVVYVERLEVIIKKEA
jgi:hypothetical protein